MNIEAIREKFILLKPFKYQYKLLISSIVFFSTIIFELLMFTFTLMVPHIHNGFYYFFKGGYHLLIDSRHEPNSCQGFIFAAVLLGYIPSIITFVVSYFIFAYWLINEILPKKPFIINWQYTSIKFILTMAHIAIIVAFFTIIPSIWIKSVGYSPKPWICYSLLQGISSEKLSERAAAIVCFLYFAIGWSCLVILTFVVAGILIYFFFKVLFIGISLLFSNLFSIFRGKHREQEDE
ncbi:hypothetical protein [Spiroplasma endosymbiont of Aspidapion aeneum]|uniref:hypothetical protein n=1 Tax=Spiroplasma endosymbiont of Aspidapion aeneum TaxID=3066276 RepID=UPI00313CFFF0